MRFRLSASPFPTYPKRLRHPVSYTHLTLPTNSRVDLGGRRIIKKMGYDSGDEAFIQDSSIPRSIFEIPGARDCAIEFRSFSKQGGFTGVRCGYVVIPKELHGYDSEGNKVSISRLWSRRTSTKFNGASYIVQRGAAALFTMEGMAQTAALISHYLGNASLLLNACRQAGMRVWGGENKMLHEANVVITPGSGFGSRGEGFFRISAFNSRENVDEVCRRIHSLFAR